MAYINSPYMDNVTHTLFALTLARTPLSRAGRGTMATLVLASNAPDIDIITTAGGVNAYLRWHRGPTHGPLGVIGLAVVVAGLVWLGRRTFHGSTTADDMPLAAGSRSAASRSGVASGLRRPASGSSPLASHDAAFPILVAISIIGVLCHVLMDFPTSYGTRLLSPFDWHWFAVDWMPIVDVYLLFVLAAGLLFGQRSPDARRRNAAIVLALMAAIYGLRAAAHHQALAVAPRLFGPLLPPPCGPTSPQAAVVAYWPRTMATVPQEPAKRCLVEIVAVPTFLSPFNWRLIAHLSNAYEVHDVDLLDTRWRRAPEGIEVLWRTTRRIPNVWTPAVQAAASTGLARTFLGFSRLPAARSAVDRSGTTTVRWDDMRFLGAAGAPQTSRFSALVRIAQDGQILGAQLNP